MSAFDRGRAAARRGEPLRSNPYDVLGSNHSQARHEQLASEWAEGWHNFDAAEDAANRSDRARKAALARWSRTT